MVNQGNLVMQNFGTKLYMNNHSGRRLRNW